MRSTVAEKKLNFSSNFNAGLYLWYKKYRNFRFEKYWGYRLTIGTPSWICEDPPFPSPALADCCLMRRQDVETRLCQYLSNVGWYDCFYTKHRIYVRISVHISIFFYYNMSIYKIEWRSLDRCFGTSDRRDRIVAAASLRNKNLHIILIV